MGRRLVEAANACRARRIRGETGFRRLLWAVFFVPGLAGEAFCGAAFAALASVF
jgi:hypothetical protein